MKKIINSLDLGSKLKVLRGPRSQAYTAKIFGIAQQTYGGWENNRSKPDLNELLSISMHYGVTTDYLLGLTDIPTAVAATGSVNVSGHSNNVANGHGSTVKTCHTADDNAEKLEALTARVKLLELAISQQIK